MRLVSDGGLHSHQKHISTLPYKILQHGKKSIQEFEESIKGNDITIVTVSGRYYAMDRDNRWERTIEANEAIAFAKAPYQDSVISFIDNNYEDNVTDEFIRPAVIGN